MVLREPLKERYPCMCNSNEIYLLLFVLSITMCKLDDFSEQMNRAQVSKAHSCDYLIVGSLTSGVPCSSFHPKGRQSGGEEETMRTPGACPYHDPRLSARIFLRQPTPTQSVSQSVRSVWMISNRSWHRSVQFT